MRPPLRRSQTSGSALRRVSSGALSDLPLLADSGRGALQCWPLNAALALDSPAPLSSGGERDGSELRVGGLLRGDALQLRLRLPQHFVEADAEGYRCGPPPALGISHFRTAAAVVAARALLFPAAPTGEGVTRPRHPTPETRAPRVPVRPPSKIRRAQGDQPVRVDEHPRHGDPAADLAHRGGRADPGWARARRRVPPPPPQQQQQ